MNTKMTKAELMEELKNARQHIAELERTSVQAGGEALFSRVFQVSPSLMALTEMGTGKYVEVNDAFLNTLGFTREEVIGKTATELNLFVDPAQRVVLLERMGQQGYLRDEFVLVRTKMGEVRYGMFTGQFVQGREQKFVLTAMNDVTSREEAKHELKEIHDRLLEAQQLAHIGNWEWDLQKQALTWSEEVYRIFGVSSAEFTPSVELFESFIHPEDKEGFLRQRAGMLEEKQFASIAHRIILPLSGEVRHVQERTQLIFDKYGNVTRVIGTVQDITEQKLAEESLRKSEELLSEAQQIGRIGHWEWVAPGRDLFCSDEFFNILNIPKNGNVVSQLTMISMLDTEDKLQLQEWDQKAFASRSDLNYEFRIRLADGRVRWLHQQAKVTYGGDGQPVRMMGAIQDITERKETELALQKSTQILHDSQAIANLGSWTVDLRTGIFDATPEGARLVGWTPGLYSADELMDIIHPDDREYMQSCWEAAMYGAPYDIEHRIILNGEVHWLHVTAKVTFDQNSAPISAIGVTQDITDRKRVEDKLHLVEKRYRMLIENAPDGIVLIGTDSKFKYASPSAEKIFGYDLNVDLELSPNELTHPDDLPMVLGVLSNLLEHPEQTPTIQYRFLNKAGDWRWIESTFSNLLALPSVEAIVINFRDVTERKRSEAALFTSEENYRKLAETSDSAIAVLNRDGRILYANPISLHVWDEPQLVGKTVHDLFTKEIADGYLAVVHRVINEQRTDTNELEIKIKGRLMWFHANMSPIKNSDGSVETLLLNAMDITDQKQILEKIESLAKFPAENPGPVLRIDLSGKLLYANDASFAYLTEWSLDVGKQAPDVVLNVARIVLETGRDKTIETIHNDRVITLDFILLQQGGYINVYGKNITEQRQAEKNVRALQEFSQSTIDALSAHLCVLDETGVILSVNAAWRAFADANPPIPLNYGVGENYLAICDNAQGDQAGDAHHVAAGLRNVLNGGPADCHFEYACHSPTEQRWFYLRAERFESHGLPRLVISHENITERKQASEALHHSELKYRSLYENLRDGFAGTSFDGVILEYNEAFRNMLGYSDAELTTMTFMDITPEKWHGFEDEIIKTQVLTRGYSDVYEKEYRHQDGTIFPIELRAQLTRDESGRPSGMWAVVRDITYRKAIEHELIRINERFTELADHISDIFWVLEPQTSKHLYISPAFTNVMGRSEEDMEQLPNGYLDIVVSEDQPIFIQKRELEASGFKTDVQYRIRRPDESIRWIRDKGTPVFDDEGRVCRIVGIASDITEQVEAAARISESEKRFQQIAETIPEVFWMFDNIQQKMTYISPAYESIWGRPVQEFYENNDVYLEAIFPEDRNIVFAALQQQANGEESEMEYRVVQPNGSIRWVHDRSFPIFDEKSGTLVRTAGIITDVTERKLTEVAMRDSEERLRLSLSAAKQGLYDLNVQTGDAVVNREYAEMLGYDPETFVETNQAWIERLHPDDVEIASRTYVNYISGLIPEYRVEFRQRTKDGKWKWILSLGSLVEYDASGKPLRLLGTHTDITEIKQAEIELQKRASQLALINDISREIASVLDIQTVLDLSARLVGEVFGYHHVGLFTMENDTGELVMRSKADEYLDFFPEDHRIKLGDGVVGSVGLSGQMILANQVQDDPHYRNFYPKVTTQSELSLPIKIAGAVVGVLDIQSPQLNAFSEEDIKVLSTLVDQVAVALENARLYEAVQKELADREQAEEERQNLIHDLGERVKELTALHQAARLFQNTAVSEADILQSLAKILPPAWQYPEITVARISVDDKEYSTPGFIETPWMQRAAVNLPNNRNAVIEVAYLEERPAEYEGPFLKEEYELIETLAERLQTALTRRSMERDLHKRTEDLANLVEAGRALSGTLDPKRIYPLIYNYIINAMPCDYLVLSSFDPQTELIKCEYMHSVEGPQDVANFPPIPLEPPGRGTQSLVIRSGESMLLPDYDSAVKTAANTVHFNDKAEIIEASPDDEEHTRSAIIVPLKVNGVVAGALQVFSIELNAHTQDHLRFVEALAFHASAALSNAKLFSELEERVRLRTAEVQDLYDNAPAGYHSLDAHGNIMLINQTELGRLGYTREEVIGRNFSNILSPESIGKFQEMFPVFKYRGSLSALELDLRRKDGSTFPVLVNATAVKDEYGNYLMSRSTVFDNTERRNAELALLEREEIYRALFESANDAIFMIAPDGVILRTNPRCEDLLGYTSDELIGHIASEFIARSDEDDAENVMTRLMAGERLPVYGRHFVRKDGTLVDTEINLSLIRDEAGRPKFIQSVVRDISARKLSENALRESEEQNRLLFEESPEAVMLFDQNGRLVRTNHAFNTLTGVRGGEFIGHLITEIGLLPQDLMNSLVLSTNVAFDQHNKFAELEFKLKNVTGEFRDINTHIFPLDLQGQRHYLASMHDITTSKRAEETLRLANAEMERALRLKDEFLANMSHELRTPLNAVLGITESLLEQISGPLNPKQQKYLQTVLESAQHLLALINDILDLAKVNAGRIDLDINKADVNVVAHTSMRMIKELAQKKEVGTTLKIDPLIKMAWLDERRLKQMLVNLLSNAVKFTPKGGRIGLDIQSDQDNKTLLFTVWDTGIGIAENDLRLLFQPFVQLDAGLARGSQGTGLGLVLVKQMARLHGGNVTVESEPGQGSRFIITLPWVNATDTDVYTRHATPSAILQQTIPAPTSIRGDRPLILLVEDTEAVTMLINDYLQQHGYSIVTAKNGFEGIDRVKEKTPDLILMDVMMPELDGMETTRRIRNDLGLVDVPIIALTALAMAGDRERCLAAGMNDYISKPVILKELLTTVEHYLNLSKEGSQ